MRNTQNFVTHCGEWRREMFLRWDLRLRLSPLARRPCCRIADLSLNKNDRVSLSWRECLQLSESRCLVLVSMECSCGWVRVAGPSVLSEDRAHTSPLCYRLEIQGVPLLAGKKPGLENLSLSKVNLTANDSHRTRPQSLGPPLRGAGPSDLSEDRVHTSPLCLVQLWDRIRETFTQKGILFHLCLWQLCMTWDKRMQYGKMT